MTPVEKITAAIAVLEQLKADSTGYSEVNGWLVESVDRCTCAGVDQYGHEAHERGCGTEPLTNDPLVVTLHRTIDAQLAILHSAVADIARWVDPDSEWGWEPQDGPTPKSDAFKAKSDLADAILGEST